ncbi:hypothetical protein HDU67_009259 [Dinochytrium kinnereticum]|nr:hypothetical protein HDU67_009259 [Dinochytrium kinnereticum]
MSTPSRKNVTVFFMAIDSDSCDDLSSAFGGRQGDIAPWVAFRIDGRILRTSDGLRRNALERRRVVVVVGVTEVEELRDLSERLKRISKLAAGTSTAPSDVINDLKRGHVELAKSAIQDCVLSKDAEMFIVTASECLRECLKNQDGASAELDADENVQNMGEPIHLARHDGSIPVINGLVMYSLCKDTLSPPVATALATLLSNPLSNGSELWLINPAHSNPAITIDIISTTGELRKCFHLVAENRSREMQIRVLPAMNAERDLAHQDNGNLRQPLDGTSILLSKAEPTFTPNQQIAQANWTRLVQVREVTVYTVRARIHGGNSKAGGLIGSGNTFTIKVLPMILQVVESHQQSVCTVFTGYKSVSVLVQNTSTTEEDSGRNPGANDDPILVDLCAFGVASIHKNYLLVTLTAGTRQNKGETMDSIFDTLRDAGIAIDMCSWVDAGTSICLAIPRERGGEALSVLQRIWL